MIGKSEGVAWSIQSEITRRPGGSSCWNSMCLCKNKTFGRCGNVCITFERNFPLVFETMVKKPYSWEVGLFGWSSHVRTSFLLELTVSLRNSVMKRKLIFSLHLSSSITGFLHSRLKTKKNGWVPWKSTTWEFDACSVHKHSVDAEKKII